MNRNGIQQFVDSLDRTMKETLIEEFLSRLVTNDTPMALMKIDGMYELLLKNCSDDLYYSFENEISWGDDIEGDDGTIFRIGEVAISITKRVFFINETDWSGIDTEAVHGPFLLSVVNRAKSYLGELTFPEVKELIANKKEIDRCKCLGFKEVAQKLCIDCRFPDPDRSVNCYYCSALIDERNAIVADKYNKNKGGVVCERCANGISRVFSALETK